MYGEAKADELPRRRRKRDDVLGSGQRLRALVYEDNYRDRKTFFLSVIAVHGRKSEQNLALKHSTGK